MRLTEYWRLKDHRYTLEGAFHNSKVAESYPPRANPSREVEVYEFRTGQPQAIRQTQPERG